MRVRIGALAMLVLLLGSCSLQFDTGRNELGLITKIRGPEWGDPIVTVCTEVRVKTFLLYDDNLDSHRNRHFGTVAVTTLELIEGGDLDQGDVVRANLYEVDGRRHLEVLEILDSTQAPDTC